MVEASSTGGPPPPTHGAGRIKKKEKGILEGSMNVFYRSDLRATLTDRQRQLEILAIFG